MRQFIEHLTILGLAATPVIAALPDSLGAPGLSADTAATVSFLNAVTANLRDLTVTGLLGAGLIVCYKRWQETLVALVKERTDRIDREKEIQTFLSQMQKDALLVIANNSNVVNDVAALIREFKHGAAEEHPRRHV